MVRRELREHIFCMVFQLPFYEGEVLPERIRLYFDTLPSVKEKDKTYIEEKFQAIVRCLPEIDSTINEKCEGWTTKRLNKVDLAVLRLAVYEMQWDEDIPTGVAINEAVELSKRYSGSEGAGFVNGVLAKIAG